MNTKIADMTVVERDELIKSIHKKHLHEINNPKINIDDDYYKNRMILLVHKKSNWHLYYDPVNSRVKSIAVVSGAKSSAFGNLSYFKRWYNYQKRNRKKTILCLTNKAIELLES